MGLSVEFFIPLMGLEFAFPTLKQETVVTVIALSTSALHPNPSYSTPMSCTQALWQCC